MPNNATTQTGSGTPQSFNDWVHKHHDSREQRLWQVQCENNRSTQSCVPSKQSTQNLFIPIFSYTQAPSQRQSRHGDKEQLERLKGIFKELDSTGLKRRLSIPRAELHEHLQQLTAQFPNFRDVIELVIAPHLHMLRTGIPMRMPPLLLVGPAGIGKTAFAHQLAKLCNAPEPVFISIAEEDNGSTLIGSSTYWANTQPGVLFATLAWGPGGMEEACNTAVANPIIILDEIDKVAFNSGQKSGTDPLGSLYRLLEVETSKRVQDRSLTDLVMDASHVRYIATANAIEPIPEPLRSRMEIFHIQAPDAQQRSAIAKNMIKNSIERLGFPLNTEVPKEVLDAMTSFEPRQLQNKIQIALALATIDQCPQLGLKHWLRAIRGGGGPAKRSIGFVPS